MPEQKPWEKYQTTEGPWSKYQEPEPSGPPPDARTPGQVAIDQAKNVAKGIPGAVTGIPSTGAALLDIIKAQLTGHAGEAVSKAGEIVRGAAQPAVTAVKGALSGRSIPLPGLTGQVQFPEFPEGDPANPAWVQAAEGAGSALPAALLPEAINRIPRTARAAGKFEQVMSKAKDVPIDTTAADAAAARATELKQRGSSMPKVLTDYTKNRAAATPETGPTTPMTYEVGRDFSSNASAMSARDITRTNAQMQRQVSQFARALKDANREAAVKVGMGDLYDQAMKEYRQASSIQKAAGVLRKYAVKGALAMGGGAAMYGVIHELTKP